MTALSNIIRKSQKKRNEPYIILTADTHEAYQTTLAKTNAIFYALKRDGFNHWKPGHRKIPDNYIQVNEIPEGVDFDFILSQNKFGQYQVFAPIAREQHLPLVSLEHTLPNIYWSEEQTKHASSLRGDLNVFISNYSIGQWGYSDMDPTVRVIKHGIDTELFKPDKSKEKKKHFLSVVNDWKNRDWCCGFKHWENIVTNFGKGPQLPIAVLGNTPGLSRAAKDLNELIDAYQTSFVFLNTSTVSPVPTSLLEAMSCGCAIISTGTCMIPEVIQNGINGLISNDLDEIRKYCELLQEDDDYVSYLSENARKTIVEKYTAERFVQDWEAIFEEASNITYRGQ